MACTQPSTTIEQRSRISSIICVQKTQYLCKHDSLENNCLGNLQLAEKLLNRPNTKCQTSQQQEESEK